MKTNKTNKQKTVLIILIFILTLLIISLSVFIVWRYIDFGSDNEPIKTDISSYDISSEDIISEQLESEPVSKPEVISDHSKAENIVSNMTLDEKIYQLIFTTPESLTGVASVVGAGDATKIALKNKPVGGIIYFAANIQNREQISNMISNSQSFSKIPLFIGVDEEGGRVARITGNENMEFEKIPSMEEIGKTGNIQKAFDIGKKLADITGSLGFNVDFAPVADIITNPNNTEIGDRSFGNDPEMVSGMVEQSVIGLQDGNISAALKHFPGHGSTQANSHDGYSESKRTLEELRQTEFLPFKAGIEAGADFVLVSHMSAINVDPSGKPASLSKTIITDILKDELGFEGLVTTDSMSMGAVTSRYSAGEAAVMAIEAGVDVLLMPLSLDDAFIGIKDAVNIGRLTEEQINENVLQIIELKIKRGIIE